MAWLVWTRLQSMTQSACTVAAAAAAVAAAAAFAVGDASDDRLYSHGVTRHTPW